mmetsp:Transcript_14024/g.55272  ORF Transcript_14024/g.55272 Transcript_14024/m.55272 type:complete len:212 (-) Transcript_14024:2599-3234(-)
MPAARLPGAIVERPKSATLATTAASGSSDCRKTFGLRRSRCTTGGTLVLIASIARATSKAMRRRRVHERQSTAGTNAGAGGSSSFFLRTSSCSVPSGTYSKTIFSDSSSMPSRLTMKLLCMCVIRKTSRWNSMLTDTCFSRRSSSETKSMPAKLSSLTATCLSRYSASRTVPNAPLPSSSPMTRREEGIDRTPRRVTSGAREEMRTVRVCD